LRKLLFPMVFVFFVGFPCSYLEASYPIECAYKDTSNIRKCPYLRPSIDTIHTLAIYCTDYCDQPLPPYWKDVWDSSEINSIPQFFRDNSYDKYILYCDPKVDSSDGHPVPFGLPDTVNSVLCTGGGADFAYGIFARVDSVVNFADYDEDQDGIVDGFFFVILTFTLPSGCHGCACLGDFSYTTHDTTASGDTIRVLGERGVEIRIISGIQRDIFIHLCAHMWGHQLGLHDLFSAAGG
jgi:hypothetical protein